MGTTPTPTGNSWDQTLQNMGLPPVTPAQIITLPPGSQYNDYLVAAQAAVGNLDPSDLGDYPGFAMANAIAVASYSLATAAPGA
jgi:hypothetical protein